MSNIHDPNSYETVSDEGANVWQQLMPAHASDPIKSKRKRLQAGAVILVGVLALVVLLLVPYIRSEILSKNAEEKLASFDLSNLQGAYDERIYDVKIISYHEKESAKVLYVLGDCEYIVMLDLEWNAEEDCWVEADGDLKWTAHGGSAGEGKFYWPFYYGHKILGW